MAQSTTTIQGQAEQVAGTAGEKGREMADTAAEKGKEVAGAAKAEVAQLGQEAADQARNVIGDAKGQLRDQARSQSDQIANALRRVEEQARALVEGRPEEAGPLGDYARQAVDQLGRMAERTQRRGVDGLVQELQNFARNRPGAFLGGAAAAGFAVARLWRSGAVTQAAQGTGGQSSPTGG
jgi:hypothetical protein